MMNLKIRLVLPFAALLAAATGAHAQIHSVSTVSTPAAQYGKIELDLNLTAEWSNPYDPKEVALDMALTAPSGKTLSLPCFYSEGSSGSPSQWKARFLPQEQGTYTYHFTLQQNGKLISQSEPATFAAAKSDKKGILRPNDLWSFRYDNGEIFRGIGQNICWEARANDDSRYFKELHENPRFNYEDMLKKLADNGGNFFRTWMIYWNLPVDWPIISNSNRYQNSTSRFNESGIKRMDELVELCDSLGIHMMLAIESHVGYMGDGWKTSNYHVDQGGFAKTQYEFFAQPESRERYKQKLRFMIARWGYSPAIGAWEFFNEVDNAMFNVPEEERLPHDIVTDWHKEMAAYFKANDPYGHIVTTSVSHRDIDGMNDLADIDVNQRHIYKHTYAIPGLIDEYTQKHHKPYIIGEFGYEWDWSINFNEIADGMNSDFKRGLWYGIFSQTPVTPMSWWWEFFDEGGLNLYFRNVRNVHDRMMDAGKGTFAKINAKFDAETITCYGVSCGKSRFIYLFNPTNETVQGTLSLENACSEGAKVVQRYNCESGIWSDAAAPACESSTCTIQGISLAPQSDLVFEIRP
jgi:hypothetical protein